MPRPLRKNLQPAEIPRRKSRLRRQSNRSADGRRMSEC